MMERKWGREGVDAKESDAQRGAGLEEEAWRRLLPP